MTAPDHTVTVTGTISRTADGWQIVLAERLAGYDTFLTGVLDLDGHQQRVRILTLDDVTVLRPTGLSVPPDPGPERPWLLHLPHGARPPGVPVDLDQAASRAGRSLGELSEADLRYALTFLGEATTPAIRTGRVAAVVDALPAAGADRDR